MDRFSDEALVLSTVDFGEADRIVTLFTRGHGRLSAFAAGARKSKRRFAGALEAGTHLTARLVTTRGDTLRLDGVDVIRSFHRIRDDLAAHRPRDVLPGAVPRARAINSPTSRSSTRSRSTWACWKTRRPAPPRSSSSSSTRSNTRASCRASPPARLSGQATGDRPRFDPEHGGVVCHGCSLRVPQGVRTV